LTHDEPPSTFRVVGSDSGRTAALSQPRRRAMKGFIGDIEERTEKNHDFRRVLYTGPHMQLVLMSLQPGEEIGEEVHTHTDQFFRVEEGKGEVVIDGVATRIEGDAGIVIPAGARHNIRNTGHKPLKLYTLYAPPEHMEGTVHPTKADAEAAVEHFTGRTTE
jgi:mannose-6-phosphate isomerase-like protein (cupin superfamily)